VVAVVAPLRHRGDGTHELTLELRPAQLGTIRAEVTLDQGTVHLSLHADDDSTTRLLRQSVPELRLALEEVGLAAGRFGVGSGDAQGRAPRHPGPGRPDDAPSTGAATGPAAATGLLRPSAAGAVDLLL
jgi:hypothetical protein